MQTLREAAAAFLSHRRIAVTGVSRDAASHGAATVRVVMSDLGGDRPW